MAVRAETHRYIADPPFARWLFSDTRAGWLWLIVRLFMGYSWIDASLHKITSPAWVSGGSALKGFWEKAVVVPATGSGPITYDWYRGFINSLLASNSYTWFGPVIAYGELLIGIGLLLGALTGIAAFFGALMNINFMLAGTASTNPVLFTLAILLMMAWKTAGWVGLDRWLLPALGTPWQGGKVFGGRDQLDEPRRPAPEPSS